MAVSEGDAAGAEEEMETEDEEQHGTGERASGSKDRASESRTRGEKTPKAMKGQREDKPKEISKAIQKAAKHAEGTGQKKKRHGRGGQGR